MKKELKTFAIRAWQTITGQEAGPPRVSRRRLPFQTAVIFGGLALLAASCTQEPQKIVPPELQGTLQELLTVPQGVIPTNQLVTQSRTTYVVYGDALGPDWVDASQNQASVDYASADPVQSGSRAIRVAMKNNGALWLRNPDPRNVQGSTGLRFWIRGNGSDIKLRMFATKNPNGGPSNGYDLTAPANTWKKFEIPWTRLGVMQQLTTPLAGVLFSHDSSISGGDMTGKSYSVDGIEAYEKGDEAALPIPGRVQFEEFNDGGQGNGYFDKDSQNKGGQYRISDGVDIEARAGAEGYNIGFVEPGEQLLYRINASKAGTYSLAFRLAAEKPGGRFLVGIGGNSLSTFVISATGSAQTWATQYVGLFTIPAGVSSMAIKFDDNQSGTLAANLDWMEFKAAEAPKPIPAKIQFEDFNQGGEGIGYHDADAINIGGKYRPSEGVDINNGSGADGYNIGWVVPGDWTRYTISVPTTGTYTLDARLAALQGGGKFSVEVDGFRDNRFFTNFTAPTTGGWFNWTTQRIGEFNLSAGTHTIKVEFDAGQDGSKPANLDWMEFKANAQPNTGTLKSMQASPSAIVFTPGQGGGFRVLGVNELDKPINLPETTGLVYEVKTTSPNLSAVIENANYPNNTASGQRFVRLRSNTVGSYGVSVFLRDVNTNTIQARVDIPVYVANRNNVPATNLDYGVTTGDVVYTSDLPINSGHG